MPDFSNRLTAAVARHGPLCVGLDPHPARLPALFGAPGPQSFERFFEGVIDASAARVAAVKPQIALFERWGPAGLEALSRLAARARAQGLLVLLDAKRGDIGSTAEGYAEAYFGADAWLTADAVTVNPYMGLDTLQPWIDLARAHHRGVIVLLRTSNPGASDIQDLDAGGAPVWRRLAEKLAPLTENWRGKHGWSSLMVVVGATAPEEARAARKILPHAPFLVPGYGAQGASAADAMAAAVKGEKGPEGVLVNASRAVLYPDAAKDAVDINAWRAAIETAIDAAQAELKAAG
ncbi:MAG: orotidine-5'-phosphate decarboxylase [Maricaulaceae bacterium]|jgi:orotidine-5'-phosphate decarboxylase